MRNLERQVLLSVLDRKWREHLDEMDYLKEGIGLRAMAQRDPLVEYQREGYDMFAAMLDGLKEESVGFLFNLQVEVQQPTTPAVAVAPGLRSPVASPAPALTKQATPPTVKQDTAAKPAAAPLPSQQAAAAAAPAPSALRAKGLGAQEPRGLTYSGPAEDGSRSVRRAAAEPAESDGLTRRERREAARSQGKPTVKAPKSKRRR